MQIHLNKEDAGLRRVDFFGNSVDGVWISLVDRDGFAYYSKKISETERKKLVDTLTRIDDGMSV